MYRLVITDAARGTRREITLGSEVVTFGSAGDNTVVVSGPEVAAHHCRIEPAAGAFKLVDLHTDHGTRVNGEYVAQKRLAPGDKIGLASLVAEFARDPKAVPAKPPAPPAPAAGVATAPAARPAAPLDPEAVERLRAAARARVQVPHSTHKLVLTGALVVLALAAVFVVPRFLPRAGADTWSKDRIALASVWAGAGRYGAAREVLTALKQEAPDDPSVIVELERLDVAEKNARDAREGLDIVKSVRDSVPDDARRRIEALAERFASVPVIGEEIVDLQRELVPPKPETPSAEPHARRDLVALRRLTDGFAAARNYSGAIAAWRGLTELDNDVDRSIRDSEIAAIDARADADAARILARADELIARKRSLAALVLLDELELTGFRGTAGYARLEGRLTELEGTVGKDLPNGEFPGAPSVLRRTNADRNGERPTARRPSNSTSSPAKPAATAVDPRVLAAIADGDTRFHAGDLAGAATAFESVLDANLDAGTRSSLSRRVERSARARRFLDHLGEQVRANPQLLDGLSFSDRAGERSGPARNATSDGALMMSTGGGEVESVPLAEIAGDSIVALARKCKWTADDQLDLANFALVDGMTAVADAAVLIAAKDPALKGGVDSTVAFLRDLPEIPEWGFFRVGDRWLTFREREQSQHTDAIEKAATLLDRDDEKSYRQGLDDLVALAPVAHDEVMALLTKRRAEHLAKLAKQPELAQVDRLLERKAELDKRRAFAFELILDEVKYFYPYAPPDVPPEKANLYAKVQQEVDDRVAKVREVWGDEFGDAPRGGIALSTSLRVSLSRLDAEGEVLFGGAPDGAPSDPLLERLALLPRAAAANLRNIASDRAERARLDRDVEVMLSNAAHKGVATEDEISQVLITNQYRLMMGRAALRIDDRLVRAARGHSIWINNGGQFGHFEDDPKRRAPWDRMKLEGYDGDGAGENVARAAGALGAHQGWCHSSGHHRNLLFNGYEIMGTGGSGALWTQNFGGAAGYTGNVGEGR